MGRISDLLPAIYYDKQNDLIRFTDCLDLEVKQLEQKVREITDLINVDKCPEDKLPYLAALTNCPLMGRDPSLWRRQIKNWPYLLKIKGTALSLEVFLNSIDVDEHKLYTFFRDTEGNLVEYKPPGEPFEKDGIWYNIRTHYFDLDIIYNDEHYLTWSEWHDDFLRNISFRLTRAKPFHSELRKLNVILTRKEELHLIVGAGVVSGVHHKINIDQKTHAESNSDLSVGASAFTGVYHVVDINQKTHSEAKSNIQVGADIFAGVQHAINIKQATQAKTRLKVIAGGNVIQSAHYVIGLKQPDTQHIKQNIFNGGGVLSGTVWRNGFNQRRP